MRTWYSRQGCAEKIEFTDDGHIPQVALSSCGLNGGPLSDIGEYPAYIACHLFTEKHDVYVGDERAPRIKQDGYGRDVLLSYVGNIKKGVTIGFRSFKCEGVKGVRIKTRGYHKGDFIIKDKWDGNELGRISVDYADVWTPFEGKAEFPDGINDLYLTFEGSGSGSLKSIELTH